MAKMAKIAKPFRELEKGMKPAALDCSEAKARKLLAEMPPKACRSWTATPPASTTLTRLTVSWARARSAEDPRSNRR